MKCFEIVRAVLEETYGDIAGSEADKDASVNVALENMTKRFGALVTGPGPDYADPATRFGYIYKYVTCHANLVCKRVEGSSELAGLFDADEVRLTCLGGGPGSDLLGILKHLETSRQTPTVTCNICDKEPFWMDSWADVGKQVGTDLRVFSNYLEHDALRSETWKTKKYLQANLVTLIFFMSEVYSLKAKAQPYFEHVFGGLPVGARVLFIDNRDSRFYGWFDEVAESGGLTIVDSDELTAKMPWEEQKEDLGRWAKKFDHNVRLDASIAYRIARKGP